MGLPQHSYSTFEIQKFEKVESEAIRDPPLQTEYFLSEESDAMTRIFGGNLLCISSISSYLLCHALSKPREEGVTSREDNVTVEILTNILITLFDQIVANLMDANKINVQELWLK